MDGYHTRKRRPTSRQLDVLRLTAEGLSREQIGQRLSIRPKTVDVHRRALLEHFRAANVAELVHRAWERGNLPVLSAECRVPSAESSPVANY